MKVNLPWNKFQFEAICRFYVKQKWAGQDRKFQNPRPLNVPSLRSIGLKEPFLLSSAEVCNAIQRAYYSVEEVKRLDLLRRGGVCNRITEIDDHSAKDFLAQNPISSSLKIARAA